MTIRLLRYLALTEGVSWLLLLFIAMPLKYIWALPLAVKYIGMIHGILFVGLGFALVTMAERTSIGKTIATKVFIASFIPFGTFVTDAGLKQEQKRSS